MYCIGGKDVRIMSHEPLNPHRLHYKAPIPLSEELLQLMTDIVLQINKYLGYDFNTVELAIRNGIPYAIDFCNPLPDTGINSVGEENFNWTVKTVASFAIERERALIQNPQTNNLTWGQFIKHKV